MWQCVTLGHTHVIPRDLFEPYLSSFGVWALTSSLAHVILNSHEMTYWVLIDIWVLSIPTRREENGAPAEVHLKLHRRLNLLGCSPCPPSITEDSVAMFIFDPLSDSRALHLLSLDPKKEDDIYFVPNMGQWVSLYTLSCRLILI